MPRNTLAIDGDFLDAPTPQDASLRFFNAARAVGATYIQTRLYRRPTRPLTSRTHYDAGGFIVRVAPEGWEGSDAFNYICFECNPLLAPIRENRTTYRFSDFAPRDRREFGAYWDALSQARIGQALCATSYGPHQAITSLHLGFERWDLPDQEARAIQMAGLMLTERLMDFVLPPVENAPALTHRERECLALVADGKSDWTISKLLHVSEATVRFHLNNARKKLGAVNRPQAVARMASRGML